VQVDAVTDKEKEKDEGEAYPTVGTESSSSTTFLALGSASPSGTFPDDRKAPSPYE